MCSRYALTSPHEAVRAYFSTRPVDPYPARYNIAPTQPALVVRNGMHGAREAVLVRWGLIPPWVKEPGDFTTLVNARCETAAVKPSFRGAMRHRRCLVPCTGYYEWTGPAGAKQAHLIRPAEPGNHGLMAMAGLWEHWLGADGSELETMAILTTAANRAMAPIHDRMPVIIAPADFERWLDCTAGRAEPVLDLLAPPADDALTATTLGRAINNVRNEGPQLWAGVVGAGSTGASSAGAGPTKLI